MQTHPTHTPMAIGLTHTHARTHAHTHTTTLHVGLSRQISLGNSFTYHPIPCTTCFGSCGLNSQLSGINQLTTINVSVYKNQHTNGNGNGNKHTQNNSHDSAEVAAPQPQSTKSFCLFSNVQTTTAGDSLLFLISDTLVHVLL